MLRAFSLVLVSLLPGQAAPADETSGSTARRLLQKGDEAPPVRIARWMQGEPVSQLTKGRIYVIDFWATWCGPCIATMAHLSDLAGKYAGQVTFIGVDVWERSRFPEADPVERVEQFLRRNPGHMNYSVAVDEADSMGQHWLRAAGYDSIPTAFIVGREGRIAWIGHPGYLDFDAALEKVTAKAPDVAAP